VTLGSLAARGVYEVLDELDGPTRAEAAPVIRRFQEQYLIDQIEVIVDNGVTVGIPPLHNDVFTAKLKSSINWTTAALKSAKTRVESAIAKVEAPYPSTAAGLTIVVGWGLPYSRTFAAPLWKTYLPALPNTNPTQYAVLDAIRFPSFETLRGVTNQWPNGYFAAGCAMHLSHLYLDLDVWYGSFDYAGRVKRMFSPRTPVPSNPSTVTIPNGPAQISTMAQVMQDATTGLLGHNALLQQAARLGADTLDNYGRLRRKGTSVPLQEDFNTLDDPFAWAPGDRSGG
jgi:hypothetical protein